MAIVAFVNYLISVAVFIRLNGCVQMLVDYIFYFL